MWRIYYGDGTEFSDVQGSPADAPALDVQVIGQTVDAVVARDVGRTLIHSHDYYWFDNGEWFGGDDWGMKEYLMRSQGRSVVKFGRYVPRAQFQTTYDRAMNDPDLPEKHAWYPNERRS